MKNDQHFHITVRPYGADPPPLTVSLTVKYSFFWWRVALPLLKEKVAYFEWNGFYWPKFELHSRDNFHQNYAFPLGNLLQICIRFLGPLLNLSCIEFDFLQNQFMLISCQFWGEEMKAKLFRTRLTYNCAHLKSTKESLTIEYLRIVFFVVKKKNVEGKYLEKEKISFVEEKKNGEGK